MNIGHSAWTRSCCLRPASIRSYVAALVPTDDHRDHFSITDAWQDVVNAVGGIRLLVHEGVAGDRLLDTSGDRSQRPTAAGITADGE